MPPGGTVGQVLAKASAANYDTQWVNAAGSAVLTDLVSTLDGGGAVLPVGDTRMYYEVRSAGTILEWALTGTPLGSLVLDVWKRAGAIPTVADTIVAAAPPTLTAATEANSATLTGWNTAIAIGDIMGFAVTSVTSITKAVLTLKVQK